MSNIYDITRLILLEKIRNLSHIRFKTLVKILFCDTEHVLKKHVSRDLTSVVYTLFHDPAWGYRLQGKYHNSVVLFYICLNFYLK